MSNNNCQWKKDLEVLNEGNIRTVVVIETAEVAEREKELLVQFLESEQMWRNVFRWSMVEGVVPLRGGQDWQNQPAMGGLAGNRLIQDLQAFHALARDERSVLVIRNAQRIIEQAPVQEILYELATDTSIYSPDARNAPKPYSMYENKSLLVLLTNNIAKFPSDLMNELGYIEVPLPTQEERERIVERFERKLKERHPDTPNPVRGSHPSLALRGAMLSRKQFEDALLEDFTRQGHVDGQFITERVRQEIAKTEILDAPLAKYNFTYVGGMRTPPIIPFIQQTILRRIREPEKAAALGITQLPNGVCYFGHPGTGKTLVIRCTAGEAKIPYVELDAGKLFSKFVGESEAKTREVFRLIRSLGKCLVFIDEIDTAIGQRPAQDMDAGANRRVFGSFLRELGESKEACFLFATNRPDRLDPAFMRAGRIDYFIPVFLPDATAREEIFQVHSIVHRQLTLPKGFKKANWKEYARLTEGYSGADIELLCTSAADLAFADNEVAVTHDHFLRAIEDYTIDKSQLEEQNRLYQALEVQLRVPKHLRSSKMEASEARQALEEMKSRRF